MLSLATFLEFLYEVIVLILGALIILLAYSGRIGLPGRPLALELLGMVLIFWGVRGVLRREPNAQRTQARVRAGSLLIVGAIVVLIPLARVRYTEYLLELAGAVLVLRGILGSALLLRRA